MHRNPSYIQHGLMMLMKWVERERMLHPEEAGTAVNKVRKWVERERMLHPEQAGTAVNKVMSWVERE